MSGLISARVICDISNALCDVTSVLVHANTFRALCSIDMCFNVHDTIHRCAVGMCTCTSMRKRFAHKHTVVHTVALACARMCDIGQCIAVVHDVAVGCQLLPTHVVVIEGS